MEEIIKHEHNGKDYPRVKFKNLDGVFAGSSAFSSATSKQVLDSRIAATDYVVVIPTAAPSGKWYVSVAAGSFTVTSDASEATTTFNYLIYKA